MLNKADQVKPEELLRVQNALIWNISPLMSSLSPPILYTVSLWFVKFSFYYSLNQWFQYSIFFRSHPYESGAPIRLLYAQEKALLLDLRDAIDRRIENKIASARRFAVRQLYSFSIRPLLSYQFTHLYRYAFETMPK